jgi:hypothetical protein
VVAAAIVSVPIWLLAGFGLGGIFVLASQVYYHYFVPVVPFAALLGAPLLARVRGNVRLPLAAVGLAVTVLWGLLIARGGRSPLYVTAAHFSAIKPTVELVRRETRPSQSVLADHDEYPYLADRQSLAHYFWDVGPLIDAHYLERRLRSTGAVVLSYGASSGYPTGFVDFLNRRYARTDTGATSVWLIPAQTANGK